MDKVQNIIKAKESMDQSPLRYKIKNNLKAPFEIDENFLRDEADKMNKLIENMDSSLRVVIMGEVKAGKSTLLNAFSGSNVSPTDIAEATGTIIEIKYSPKEYGKITMDNNIIEDNPDVIYSELQNNNNNQKFFENCISVEFGFPFTNLKNFTLVDTPGLETITEENSNRTKDYIANTDVVLWVFNGHHLGQADIEEALIEVNRFGKPIIAVINRIDEMDEDPEILKEYLDEEIGMFVEEIIPLSAYKANKAVQSNDTNSLKDSGFTHLMEYINSNISSNSDEIKNDVIIKSAKALLNRDLLIHEEYIKTLGFIQEQVERIDKKINMYSDRIHKHILYQFETWYKNEFLSVEREDLKNKIKQSGIFNLKNDKKEVDYQLQSIFSEEYISEKLNKKINNLDELYIDEWKEAVEKVKNEVQIELNEFKNEAEKQLELKLNNNSGLKDGESDLLSGASKGAWLGGATGAASAFYAAALGPAATTVTAGMAVTAFLPPMLLIGVTIGAVSSALKFKSEKSLAEKNIDDIFISAKEEHKNELFNSISEKYIKQNEQIKENINSLIIKSFLNEVESEEVISLKIQLEKYLFETKKTIEEFNLIEA
ncbi:dynamin family protein [Salirhabdus salicampi]|uniref:dynamin family protein n=1 Tax=Salirhabdus salicampi TaxID=476102 RepID=UPI0020C5A8C1|nr:dynamin family protein [Salirhabdus salicampi]MCP8616375.1 dynamin family protein [Salirhabdus salicampi]